MECKLDFDVLEKLIRASHLTYISNISSKHYGIYLTSYNKNLKIKKNCLKTFLIYKDRKFEITDKKLIKALERGYDQSIIECFVFWLREHKNIIETIPEAFEFVQENGCNLDKLILNEPIEFNKERWRMDIGDFVYTYYLNVGTKLIFYIHTPNDEFESTSYVPCEKFNKSNVLESFIFMVKHDQGLIEKLKPYICDRSKGWIERYGL